MTDPTITLKEYILNLGLQDCADFLCEGVEPLSQMVLRFGGMVFHLDAIDLSNSPVTSFSAPISQTVSYDESTLPDYMDEADLDVYRYDAGLSDWVTLTVISRDLLANTITVELDHLSEFAILAPVDREIPPPCQILGCRAVPSRAHIYSRWNPPPHPWVA